MLFGDRVLLGFAVVSAVFPPRVEAGERFACLALVLLIGLAANLAHLWLSDRRGWR